MTLCRSLLRSSEPLLELTPFWRFIGNYMALEAGLSSMCRIFSEEHSS